MRASSLVLETPLMTAADALRSDRVRVVLALDEDEAPVAAVFPVLREDGVGRGAGARKGIENEGIGVGGHRDDLPHQISRLGSREYALLSEDVVQLLCRACRRPDILPDGGHGSPLFARFIQEPFEVRLCPTCSTKHDAPLLERLVVLPLRKAPTPTRRWVICLAGRGVYDLISQIRPHVWSIHRIKGPGAARVVVRVGETALVRG